MGRKELQVDAVKSGLDIYPKLKKYLREYNGESPFYILSKSQPLDQGEFDKFGRDAGWKIRYRINYRSWSDFKKSRRCFLYSARSGISI